MNKKIIYSLIGILSFLVITSIFYVGTLFIQKNRKIQTINQVNLEEQIENKQTNPEEDISNQIGQSNGDINTNKQNREESKEKETIPEQTEKEKKILIEITKMSNEELIILLENILSTPPNEIILKYDVDYLNGALHVLGDRIKDMSEDQKQKVMKIIEKSKSLQTKEDN